MRKTALFIFIALMFTLGACKDKGGKTSYSLDVDMNNKPEMNICLQATGYTDKQVREDPNAALIDELTGYKTNYSQLPAVDDTTALNLAFVNRTKYHAIKVTKEQYNMLLAQEALVDIKPALEKFGTDIYANGDISEYSWSVVSKDGGIYGIPEGGPPTLGQENVVDCIMFRVDLLWEDGFDLPSTREEFTEILRFYKNKYGKDFYPLTTSSDMSLIPAIAVSFDIYQEWSLVDGKYTFYLEHPRYKEYMEYVISLVNEGLVDPNVIQQDKVAAYNTMGKGNAIAYAGSLYELDNLIGVMEQNHLYNSGEAVEDVIGAVGGFLDSEGKVHTYHRGGYSYVTVIPSYMAEYTAYTVDYLSKKLKDENFRQIVLGTKDVHYRETNEGYVQIDPAFSEKTISGFFCTGLNERTWGAYYACRSAGGKSTRLMKELNKNSDEEGTYNPLSFTNYLTFYDTVCAELEKYARERAVDMMFGDKSTAKYESVLSEWRNKGGTKGSEELDKWCKQNWEGHYKVPAL